MEIEISLPCSEKLATGPYQVPKPMLSVLCKTQNKMYVLHTVIILAI